MSDKPLARRRIKPTIAGIVGKGRAEDGANTRARSDIAAEVCARMLAGESINVILGDDRPEHFPSARTWWRWLVDDPGIAAAYDDALARRSERYAEEIVAITDEKPPLEQTQFGQKHDSGYVAWQKNRVDARKWVASRLLPKKYGDRTVIAGDADNPIAIDDPKAILARRLAAAAAGGGTPSGDS
jgi:hypothetical protein